mmetsp:Transcript_96372/g.257787  ORF Transcript_96372/g.257787 Transcript_96372/m.257787 type:complete len:100 (+) Transcript_96372:123-422(+)
MVPPAGACHFFAGADLCHCTGWQSRAHDVVECYAFAVPEDLREKPATLRKRECHSVVGPAGQGCAVKNAPRGVRPLRFWVIDRLGASVWSGRVAWAYIC